jgi:predicted outer membrane repeat protein
MRIKRRPNIRFAIVVIFFFARGVALQANTITVTNTNDSGPGSLRQVLADANDGDTIDFAVTGTIGLTSGELLVDTSITISGPGADNLAVDGNATYRGFHVGPGETVTISDLTVTHGNASGEYPDNDGGGIYNDHATLMINNCAINGNTAANFGGGIYSNGGYKIPNAVLSITNSSVSGNSAEQSGGGIFSNGAFSGHAHLQITNSTVSGNSAVEYGGGIYNSGSAGEATLEAENSTFSDNSVQLSGGGLYNDGAFGLAAVLIREVTFFGNVAQSSGGSIFNFKHVEAGQVTVDLSDTILMAGAAGGNISNDLGTVTSAGYNLSSDDGGGFLTGPGDQINTDPLLGPLQDNGGPTLTHRPFPGSSAIDAGNPSFTPPPFYDQRGPGFDRVVNGRLDIGSFEVQNGKPTPTPTPRPIPTPRSRPAPHPRPTPP